MRSGPTPPVESSATSATWHVDFRDTRPPQEIVWILEGDLTKLFSAAGEEGQLVYSAQKRIAGAPYDIQLRFEAALPDTNGYSLRATVSLGNMKPELRDYFRKTSGWIDFWTRDFTRSSPAAKEENSPERYARLRDAALQAEAHLNSVVAIQQAIVVGMKRGGTFSTAHKEGGTNIKWSGDRFVRSDYGEDPDLREYKDEAEFFGCLRQFYDSEISMANYPNKVPDLDAWKLILRKLYFSPKSS